MFEHRSTFSSLLQVRQHARLLDVSQSPWLRYVSQEAHSLRQQHGRETQGHERCACPQLALKHEEVQLFLDFEAKVSSC